MFDRRVMILVPSGGAVRLLRRRGFEKLAWLSPSMGHAGADVDTARIHEQASPPLEFRCFAAEIAPQVEVRVLEPGEAVTVPYRPSR